MKKILLYCGQGVGRMSYKLTFIGLQNELGDSFQVHPVFAHDFLAPGWEEKTALVVFPGGRDIPYHLALKGEPNSRISGYVASGGKYLGICAGAYYASSQIEYEKGLPGEIVEKRELAFFPGKAIGPASGVFCSQGGKYAEMAPIVWKQEKKSHPLYFNQGCFFETPDKHANTLVLATYEKLQQPAILLCEVGKGRALLSGIHPEFPHPDPQKEPRRLQFWKKFLKTVTS